MIQDTMQVVTPGIILSDATISCSFLTDQYPVAQKSRILPNPL